MSRCVTDKSPTKPVSPPPSHGIDTGRRRRRSRPVAPRPPKSGRNHAGIFTGPGRRKTGDNDEPAGSLLPVASGRPYFRRRNRSLGKHPLPRRRTGKHPPPWRAVTPKKGDIFVMDAFATAPPRRSLSGRRRRIPPHLRRTAGGGGTGRLGKDTHPDRAATSRCLWRRENFHQAAASATHGDTLPTPSSSAAASPTPSCWHKAIPSANRLSKAIKKTTRKRYKIRHKTSSCRKRLSSPRNRTPQPEETSHCPALAQKK